ncbi:MULTISPECIES: hypothetical protein [Enterobacter]|jgi:hypothetical protein|uniref:hypothetical protein n=1 Tax=Enterobacter TaxID=547 RepID=UPI0011789396|nr:MULTISPECIES: hypothetical protein [Enterobacter]MCM7621039.1 hypothetical protein [Enterobacter vonholyi]MEB7623917.1 hypothetical protein [Enterobacter vonholyi]
MKLPKHAPESTLIEENMRHLKYIQNCHNKNKTIIFQCITINDSIQNKHKKLLITELSQNYTAAFQHIYPATYQVYITSHQDH